MACEDCERRRELMALWAAAVLDWTKNPTGPSIQQLYKDRVNSLPPKG
jgi:hypothetical protein